MFFSHTVLLLAVCRNAISGGAHLTFPPPRAHDRVIPMQTPFQLKTLVTVCRSKE